MKQEPRKTLVDRAFRFFDKVNTVTLTAAGGIIAAGFFLPVPIGLFEGALYSGTFDLAGLAASKEIQERRRRRGHRGFPQVSEIRHHSPHILMQKGVIYDLKSRAA